MSAPRTNIETQKRWHRAPIIGMVGVVIFALGLLFWQMVIVAGGTTSTDGTGTDTPVIDQNDAVPESIPVPPNGAPADAPQIPDGDLPAQDIPAPAPDLPGDPLPDTGNQPPVTPDY